jgi:hypothetical protein
MEPSEVDSTVDTVPTSSHLISLSLSNSDPSVSDYQYVQFSSDQLRHELDAVILIPAHVVHPEDPDLPSYALRQVWVPKINPLKRRTDTLGFLSIHLNPDIPPDALRRADIPQVAVGDYKLAYVRYLAEAPREKFILSETFHVGPGKPSQPGQVQLARSGEQLSLSWAPPMFSGQSGQVTYHVEYCSATPCPATWESAGDPADGETLDVPADICSGLECKWRVRAVNEYGYSKAGWIGSGSWITSR